VNQPPLNPDAIRELTEAIRLTVEYVGTGMLPAIPGWSWYDAMVKYAPNDAEVLRAMEPLPEASAALSEVNTVEELDQLPAGTILRDYVGLALNKRATGNWWATNGDKELTSIDLAEEIADTAHTYRVLYLPGEGS